jgi:predicted 3-demethylubiquinone-9 3-methyltransferase (glyoxalase superfamily)
VVQCGTQKEIDRYWDKPSEGGDKNAQACGWLKDKYGLSWQIVPKVLAEMQTNRDSLWTLTGSEKKETHAWRGFFYYKS